MREYLLAQIVHYVLAHRLHHYGLGVLDNERCDAGEQEDDGDESDTLIRAMKPNPSALSFKKPAKPETGCEERVAR